MRKTLQLRGILLGSLLLNTASAVTPQLWTDPVTPRQTAPVLQGLNTALITLT